MPFTAAGFAVEMRECLRLAQSVLLLPCSSPFGSDDRGLVADQRHVSNAVWCVLPAGLFRPRLARRAQVFQLGLYW